MQPSFLNNFVFAGLLALAGASPASAEWRDVSYADVAKMPLALQRVDPARIYTVAYFAKPAGALKALPADFQMQLKLGEKLTPVPVRPDGRIEIAFRQDWADAGAVVQTNQPKERVKISMQVDARTPPGQRMTYAQLTESVPVMERGIKEIAGVMSFLAPKVRGLTLRFEKGTPQTVTLTLPGGGKKLWKTDAEGHANLPWEPKWLAAVVELSAPLKGIDQVLK